MVSHPLRVGGSVQILVRPREWVVERVAWLVLVPCQHWFLFIYDFLLNQFRLQQRLHALSDKATFAEEVLVTDFDVEVDCLPPSSLLAVQFNTPRDALGCKSATEEMFGDILDPVLDNAHDKADFQASCHFPNIPRHFFVIGRD